MENSLVPAELQQVVSDALGYPFPTVSIYARRLREAGVLTKGGRGKSAPNMEVSDAAKLLVSLLWSTGVNDAVSALERSDSATIVPGPGRMIGFLDIDPVAGASATGVMLKLLEGYLDGSIAEYHASIGGAVSTLGTSVRLSFWLNGRRAAMVEYVPGIRGMESERCLMMQEGDLTPNPDYQSINRISGASLLEIASRFSA